MAQVQTAPGKGVQECWRRHELPESGSPRVLWIGKQRIRVADGLRYVRDAVLVYVPQVRILDRNHPAQPTTQPSDGFVGDPSVLGIALFFLRELVLLPRFRPTHLRWVDVWLSRSASCCAGHDVAPVIPQR